MKVKVLIPGLVLPGGGYLALGAWRQGFAFLTIGVLVAALWTDLFTEFRYGLLLFWGVLSLAGILGAEQVSRTSLGEGLGLAWIINGTGIFIALEAITSVVIGRADTLAMSGGGPIDMSKAVQLMLMGELGAFALGGCLMGLLAPRPLRTALWSALLAVGWASVRGANEVGVEAAIGLIRARWPQLAVLYGGCLAAAFAGALALRLIRRKPTTPSGRHEVKVIHPPPVTPARQIQLHGPDEQG